MNEPERVNVLQKNVSYLRNGLTALGYEIIQSPTAILPIIVGDTAKAIKLSKTMLDYGILITGFGYPVVPEGKARLRAQVSATHKLEHLDRTIEVFKKIKAENF